MLFHLAGDSSSSSPEGQRQRDNAVGEEDQIEKPSHDLHNRSDNTSVNISSSFVQQLSSCNSDSAASDLQENITFSKTLHPEYSKRFQYSETLNTSIKSQSESSESQSHYELGSEKEDVTLEEMRDADEMSVSEEISDTDEMSETVDELRDFDCWPGPQLSVDLGRQPVYSFSSEPFVPLHIGWRPLGPPPGFHRHPRRRTPPAILSNNIADILQLLDRCDSSKTYFAGLQLSSGVLTSKFHAEPR